MHAVLILVPGSTFTLEEMRAHCQAHIATYKTPRNMEIVEAYPVSGAGKVLKRELRAPYWEGVNRSVN